MNKLRLKFSVFEKRLSMQIIEQSPEITGSPDIPVDFKASNGIVIVSNSRPGIYPELNQINIRGVDSSSDLDIVYGKFNTTEEAVSFMNKVKDAVEELFNTINKKEINRLSRANGEIIKLPNCEILINTVKGSFVFQLINSNFDYQPSNIVINNETLSVSFDEKSGENLMIYLPFKSTDPQTCLINTSKLTESASNELLNKIVYNLSGIETHTCLEHCENQYPDMILHSM